MAWSARDGELRAVAAGARPIHAPFASCWRCRQATGRFLVARDLAKPYGRARGVGHRAARDATLAAPGTLDPRLRNLAPDVSPTALLELWATGLRLGETAPSARGARLEGGRSLPMARRGAVHAFFARCGRFDRFPPHRSLLSTTASHKAEFRGAPSDRERGNH
jgi:hypothetical protein